MTPQWLTEVRRIQDETKAAEARREGLLRTLRNAALNALEAKFRDILTAFGPSVIEHTDDQMVADIGEGYSLEVDTEAVVNWSYTGTRAVRCAVWLRRALPTEYANDEDGYHVFTTWGTLDLQPHQWRDANIDTILAYLANGETPQYTCWFDLDREHPYEKVLAETLAKVDATWEKTVARAKEHAERLARSAALERAPDPSTQYIIDTLHTIANSLKHNARLDTRDALLVAFATYFYGDAD